MKIKTMQATDYAMTETEWAIYQRQNRMGRLMHHHLRDHATMVYRALLRNHQLETALETAGRKLAIEHLRRKRLTMAENPPMGPDLLSRAQWEQMASEIADETLPAMIEAVTSETVIPMIHQPESR